MKTKETFQRNIVIDSLRALAIILIILIHALSLYLGNDSIRNIWDTLQFSVPLFVFCSSHLFIQKHLNFEHLAILPYLKKRFLRLLLPYYAYLLFILILSIFTKQITSFSDLVKNIFLVGSVDLSWVVWLFGSLAIIQVLLWYTYKNNKLFTYISVIIFLACAIWFTVYRPSIEYRFLLWTTWPLLIIFTFIIYKLKEDMENIFFLTSFIAVGTACFYWVLLSNGYPVFFYQHKYPPSLYFLMYGALGISIFYVIIQKFHHLLQPLQPAIHFLSTSSYSLFFIHYAFLEIGKFLHIERSLDPYLFFLILFSGTILFEIMKEKVIKKIRIPLQDFVKTHSIPFLKTHL
ncbi:MAG: acyltransferase family protein [Candidatus Roizmanbacteria bacterium]